MTFDKNRDLATAFLEISAAEWEELVSAGIAHDLVKLIPTAVEYQDRLEQANKFFVDIKELETAKKLDAQLHMLDAMRAAITSTVQDDRLDASEVKGLLVETQEDIQKAFTAYTKVEAETIEEIRKNSKRIPKEAFFDKVRSFWNHIDEFWTNEREGILGKWEEYLKFSTPFLKKSVSVFRVPNSTAVGTLIQVEALLKKRSSKFLAQRVGESKERIKQYVVEELGLIPGFVGAKGNWKVEKDDCPEPGKPDKHTKLTDRFAFCHATLNGKEKTCPAFAGTQGSYVKCKSFGVLKEAALLSDIQVLNDEDLLSQIQEVATTDPFVKQLLISARRTGGVYYVGKATDDRLETMLDQYPQSNRKGKYDYKVYLIANEPIFLSGGYAISADKVLLETIGEGARMPKTATTTRIAGPIVRITFTANALRDPEFRDFLRKKKAVKYSIQYTYDIPFESEEDISLLISEIRDEFGYPIQVFEIVEDADIVLEKDFGVYDYKRFPIVRYSAFSSPRMLYVPRVRVNTALNRSTYSLAVAEKLVDAANNLGDKNPLRPRLAHLADKMRVGSRLLIATRSDIVVYADKAVGVIPEVGTRLQVRDPDSGQVVAAEVVEVVRDNAKTPGEGTTYKLRTLDSGKEIEFRVASLRKHAMDVAQAKRYYMRQLQNGWTPEKIDKVLKEDYAIWPSDLRQIKEQLQADGLLAKLACNTPGDTVGCGGPLPPLPMPPALTPPPVIAPEGPPVGQFMGEDGVVYIIQGPPLPEPAPMHPVDMGPPAPAFPAEHLPAFPPLKIPPRFTFPPADFPPPPPMGGPVTEMAPPPPPPPPIVQHGPVTESVEVFVPQKTPSNPDKAPEGRVLNDSEREIIEDIKNKVTPAPGNPKLVFKNSPFRDPAAPSGAREEDVEDAVKKLKDQFKGDPRIKEVRRDLNPSGKPILYVHTTMPKALRKEVPTTMNGFQVEVAPLHDSSSSGTDKEAADSIVAPIPNRPQNGKSEVSEPGPYLNQVSPPAVGDEMVRQVRDIPKGS